MWILCGFLLISVIWFLGSLFCGLSIFCSRILVRLMLECWKSFSKTKEFFFFSNWKYFLFDYYFLSHQTHKKKKWKTSSKFFGVITFSPMNYQKMRNAPMNYQLDQYRAFNYQRQSFSPLPSIKGFKTNGQRVTWPSHAVLSSFSSFFPPMNYRHLPLSRPMNYHYLPTCPYVKRHMTRWLFLLTPFNWRKGRKWLSLVVGCSILDDLVVHGGKR
jgi:hypothetical protein